MAFDPHHALYGASCIPRQWNRKGDWFQSLLFALSIAVGLTPEMLPMLITTNLAKGAIKMARDKVIVKQLNSIQIFGAMIFYALTRQEH